MSKWMKRILSLAAVGGVIAGLAYYFKKSECDYDDDYMDDFEDEDFDLDNDLKPVTDREYVPLNSVQKDETETSVLSGSNTADKNMDPNE